MKYVNLLNLVVGLSLVSFLNVGNANAASGSPESVPTVSEIELLDLESNFASIQELFNLSKFELDKLADLNGGLDLSSLLSGGLFGSLTNLTDIDGKLDGIFGKLEKKLKASQKKVLKMRSKLIKKLSKLDANLPENQALIADLMAKMDDLDAMEAQVSKMMKKLNKRLKNITKNIDGLSLVSNPLLAQILPFLKGDLKGLLAGFQGQLFDLGF